MLIMISRLKLKSNGRAATTGMKAYIMPRSTRRQARRHHKGHINSFPQYKVKITDDDGYEFDIHFAALFSDRKDALPKVFLHG